jgi:MFS family permease
MVTAAPGDVAEGPGAPMSTASARRDSIPPSPSPLQVPAFRALLLAQTCFGVAFSTFFILPKFLSVQLQAGPSQVGWIMATASLANVLAVRPVAAIAGRLGGRRTLVLGCLFMAAGALAFAAVASVGPLAFVGRILQGLGWAFMFSASGALVLVLAPPGRLSQAIALHGSANLLTNAIGPALAEPGIALLGPAPVFAAVAGVAVVGAWLSSRLDLPRVPAVSTTVEARQGSGGPMPRFLVFVGVVVGVGCGTMLTFHQPLALLRGSVRVSDFLIAYTIGAVGIRLALGRLIDRMGPGRVAFVSFLFYGGVIAAMVGLVPRTLALHGALFGLAHGLFWPSFMAMVLQTAAPAARNRSIAWVNGSFNAGVVSVAALGLLADRAGYVWVFVPVGLLVTATALGLRPRPGRRALPG